LKLAASDQADVTRHASHVVRRMLLRRSIVIDPEIAILVVEAVSAVLQAERAPQPRPRRRRIAVGEPGCDPLF
jgi:hypothetical protein